MAFFGQKTAKDFLGNLIGGATIREQGKKKELDELAVKEMALYTAVSFVADLIAGCDIRVYENDKPIRDGTWYLWNVSANPNQSAKQLMFEWIFNYYTKGRGLVVPLSRRLYVADKFAIDEYPLKGNMFSGISIRSYGIDQTFRANKVYYLDQGPKEIKKMLDGIFEGYAMLLEDERSASGKNGGEKYVLNLETLPSGTEETKNEFLKKTRENLTTFTSGDTGSYIATKGQTLTRFNTASSTSSASYIALRKEVYAICAAALHIPSGLLEGNSTAADQMLSQALATAIEPLAKKISAELTRKTYTQEEILYKGCRMQVDTSAIKHIEMVDVADSMDKYIANGSLCIDEVRKHIGLPELNTDWSQKHYLTKNYSDIAEADPLEDGGSNEEEKEVLPVGDE